MQASPQGSYPYTAVRTLRDTQSIVNDPELLRCCYQSLGSRTVTTPAGYEANPFTDLVDHVCNELEFQNIHLTGDPSSSIPRTNISEGDLFNAACHYLRNRSGEPSYLERERARKNEDNIAAKLHNHLTKYRQNLNNCHAIRFDLTFDRNHIFNQNQVDQADVYLQQFLGEVDCNSGLSRCIWFREFLPEIGFRFHVIGLYEASLHRNSDRITEEVMRAWEAVTSPDCFAIPIKNSLQTHRAKGCGNLSQTFIWEDLESSIRWMSERQRFIRLKLPEDYPYFGIEHLTVKKFAKIDVASTLQQPPANTFSSAMHDAGGAT